MPRTATATSSSIRVKPVDFFSFYLNEIYYLNVIAFRNVAKINLNKYKSLIGFCLLFYFFHFGLQGYVYEFEGIFKLSNGFGRSFLMFYSAIFCRRHENFHDPALFVRSAGERV